ncbi:hypothetical protein PRZ48_011667 [Zasmidium cellare]|uniref:Glycoside hydrolase family 43 protein n=1 Tax=Zasmidium cellare TaxID=395010 RepID=A0ABR0E709_ZASCE|nr:hypothetical protein PRZ48_011667 [Zasmidium cellare]
MKLPTLLATFLPSFTLSSILPRQDPEFAGYLISTFSDPIPAVQWHLSTSNSPSSFTFLNNATPILTSTVGTGGVRDIFLTTDGDRKRWFLLATDLDINAEGFSWDEVTRRGSRGLVVWESGDLGGWEGPRLVTVEDPTAGMAWAPSAVWDADTQQFFVFWSSRHYAEDDVEHVGNATLDRIRFATTTDFVSFSEPRDYLALEDTPLIDQEFVNLGRPGHWARFLKNETVNQVYQETTTEGLFSSEWERVKGYVRPESPREGTVVFGDNAEEGLWHLWVDDYTEYVPYQTRDVLGGGWMESGYEGFPRGLKHGCVTPLTAEEVEVVRGRYG